ncbi:hypothetical protein D3C85_1646940 [compost metagenome]
MATAQHITNDRHGGACLKLLYVLQQDHHWVSCQGPHQEVDQHVSSLLVVFRVLWLLFRAASQAVRSARHAGDQYLALRYRAACRIEILDRPLEDSAVGPP